MGAEYLPSWKSFSGLSTILPFPLISGRTLHQSGGSPLISPATTAGPQDATTLARVYGLPLLSYSNLAPKIEEHKGAFVTNDFYHQGKLATAGG